MKNIRIIADKDEPKINLVYISNILIGKYYQDTSHINVLFFKDENEISSCSNYQEALDWLVEKDNNKIIYNKFDLLYCPFCGEASSQPYTTSPDRYFWYIKCPNCLLEMEGRSLRGLVDRWNTRFKPNNVTHTMAEAPIKDCYCSTCEAAIAAKR